MAGRGNRSQGKRPRENNVEDSASRNTEVEQSQNMMRAMEQFLHTMSQIMRRQMQRQGGGKPVAEYKLNVEGVRCKVCQRKHPGQCFRKTEKCFRCGGSRHFIKDCPSKPGEAGNRAIAIPKEPKGVIPAMPDSERPKCKYCRFKHFGECRLKSGACFRCGSKEHKVKGCPQEAQTRVYHLSTEEEEEPRISTGGKLLMLDLLCFRIPFCVLMMPCFIILAYPKCMLYVNLWMDSC